MPKVPIPINLRRLKPWVVTYRLFAVLMLVVKVVGRMDFLVGESKSASLYGSFGNVCRRKRRSSHPQGMAMAVVVIIERMVQSVQKLND